MLALAVCGPASPSWAADGTTSPSGSAKLPPSAASSEAADALFDFDLPAQPLIDALQHYGVLTRQPALFRSEIVDGLTSTAVSGRYSAKAALHLLLSGTGLVAEKFDHDVGGTFILKPAIDAKADGARVANLGSMRGYPSLIQTRVWQALCGNPRTAPGGYRSLLSFRVDASGQIQRVRLVASSGDADRDAAMLDVLVHVRMGSPPPPELAQPVAVLLMPHEAGVAMRCDQLNEAS